MQNHDYVDDEISLRKLIRTLYRRKWTIALVTFVCAIVAVVYAFKAVPVYTAEALLINSDSNNSGKLSSLASSFGGVAAIAGIDLPGAGEKSDTKEAIAILKSRKFILQFVDENNLKPILFHGRWNREENTWYPLEHGIYEKTVIALNNLLDGNSPPIRTNGEPTDREVYEKFQRIQSIGEDKKTGLVTLGIEWTDSVQAANWTNQMVARVNRFMRDQAKDELTKSIEYLNDQVQRTTLVEAHNVLFKLIEDQTKSIMLANVRDEFVFRVIDPAVVVDQPTKPKKKIVLIIGVLIGFFGSVLLILLVDALKEPDYE